MYREIRACGPKLDELDSQLRTALLAEDTRQIGTAATTAQALALELLRTLKEQSDSGSDSDVNPAFVAAAISSLNRAWQHAESVALGTNATEMRAHVVDFKTSADFARAYLRAAIGTEEV